MARPRDSVRRYLPTYNPLTNQVEVHAMTQAARLGVWTTEALVATIPVERPKWHAWLPISLLGAMGPLPSHAAVNASMARAVDLIVGGLK